MIKAVVSLLSTLTFVTFIVFLSSIVMDNAVYAQPYDFATQTNINKDHDFENSFVFLANETRSLSLAYQDEIAKWQSGLLTNDTIVDITDLYVQEFQRLLSQIQQLNPSLPSHENAKGNFSKSIESEISSHQYFADYIDTGNKTKDDISIQLLTDALKYEEKAFAAFNNASH